MNNIKIFFNLKSSVFQFAIVMMVLCIITILSNVIADYDQEFFTKMIVSFFTLNFIGIFYVILSKSYLNDKFLNPNNTAITVMILFLLLFPLGGVNFILMPLALIITLFVAKLLRYRSQPIFNPAAIGLMISFIIFEILIKIGLLQENIFISWWGANLFKGVLPLNLFEITIGILLTLIIGYYGYFYKKLNLTISFILTYLLLSFVNTLGQNVDVLAMLTGFVTGSLFFLAFVMIAEPKTSPTNKNDQIVYGIIGGILFFALLVLKRQNLLFGYTGSVELSVILILNLIFFLQKNWKFLFTKDETKIQNPQS